MYDLSIDCGRAHFSRGTPTVMFRLTLLLVAVLSSTVAFPGDAAAPSDALGPVHVTAEPLDAKWTYSRAGGAFGTTPPAGAPAANRDGVVPLTFRGVFTIADPAAIAGLWIRIAEPGDAPRASICNGDLKAASGGYWKDLGYCPTLLDAAVLLNGKPVPSPHGPILTQWLPIEGELQAGENTVELSGTCYTFWQSPPAEAIVARLATADAQEPTIYNGPLLGDFGPDYFTLGCRTNLPAELTVTATPTSPPGPPVTATSPRRIWHRLRVDLPAGTVAADYTLTAKVGNSVSHAGPFKVRLPDKPENGFRFVALGEIQAHTTSTARWANTARLVESLQPALIAHTGNCNEHGTWEFKWQFRYFDPAGSMLSSIPTLLTPCSGDTSGVVDELHCTPADGMYGHTWTKVVGPVRFIGLDSRMDWAAGSENVRWLEQVLTAARERFIFVLSGYPAYSSGKNSKKVTTTMAQLRDVIMPLLGKHRVSAMISGNESDYERCEPPPEVGVTQLVAGGAGKYTYRYSGSAVAINPYAKGKGHDWGGAEGTSCLCVFDVTPERVEMRTISIPGDPAAEPRQLDTRTFLPR